MNTFLIVMFILFTTSLIANLRSLVIKDDVNERVVLLLVCLFYIGMLIWSGSLLFNQ